MKNYVIKLAKLDIGQVEEVGGKNASLGEMIQNLSELGVRVPGGFATTAQAYRDFIAHNNLDQRINDALKTLDINDVTALAATGKKIRQWVMDAQLQPDFYTAIEQAYEELVEEYGTDATWAVRSSATAEDLPDASFAGQQETYLNISGLDAIKHSIHKVFSSLFTDRAIAYREHQGFDHAQVALSVGIQKMVRSDLAASGVMFTLDTESGFRDVVFITGSYGLGEMVVQGAVNPDEFYVHKPTLDAGRPSILRRTLGAKATRMVYAFEGDHPVKIVDVEDEDKYRFCLIDSQIEELARQAMIIEKHYQMPMDIEWALDGNDDALYIVQARPETVQKKGSNIIERFFIKEPGTVLVEGRSIGSRIGSGSARLIANHDQMSTFNEGDVLVTDMTDPDWEPIMKRASAIVTNRGGRTCHAAIIARELGVPAVVGCGDATKKISNHQNITVSCSEGDTGFVYDGIIDYEVTRTELDKMPEIPTKIMMNVGNPGRAFDFCQLPHSGVGLARMEFIINNMIGIHPQALIEYDKQSEDIKKAIAPRIAAYRSPREFFIQKIVEGVSSIAAAFSPEKVIVRMSDFKSNEYANLIAGARYEPDEENPMLGFRGASRYVDSYFRNCFDMECEAIRRVRNDMGFKNLEIMIPFVRTLTEAQSVIDLLSENGLKRGTNDLRIIMMCELPSNAVNADAFLEYFDGFSIGSNDLTQLTLGMDRDSAQIAHDFDERDPAVKKMFKMAIKACHSQGKYVGICGQGPSDHPDLAHWLMKQQIDSLSLNPDTVVSTWLELAKN